MDVIYILGTVALAGAIFLAEILVGGWRNSSLRRLCRANQSDRIDIIFFVLNLTGATTILIAAYTFGLSTILGVLASKIPVPHFLVPAAAWVIVLSFVDYWLHRLWHTRRFWHIHKIHHSSTTMNPLVAYRNNPANLIFEPVIGGATAAFLAAGPHVSIAISAFWTAQLLLIHMGRPWHWGWFGKWILVSPGAHLIHHSTDPVHQSKNLSTIFPIWDHLFGTWYDGSKPVVTTGVDKRYDWRSLPLEAIRDLRAITSRQP